MLIINNQNVMCYISIDLSRQALQTNGKLISKFQLVFELFYRITETFSTNNKVGFMQAWWGRHLC